MLASVPVFAPDLAPEPGGLPIAAGWLLLAVAVGVVGLRTRRALAAKRARKPGDRGQGS